MTEKRQSIHGEWTSRWAFILAATGAAVGLGNIWKFPYIAGINGGGAFVLIYLACVLIIGIPLMMTEVLIGRRGRQNPAGTMRSLAKDTGRSKHWQWIGAIGILSSFIILSYYCVIAGWAMNYIFRAASGAFHHASASQINHIFQHFVANPWKLLFWHSMVMLVTIFLVIRGVKGGLELAARFMFPAMLGLLIVLVIYATTTNHFIQGLTFLFKPDFSKLNSTSALSALGHAFFTLSLATGSIMMYGAYLPKKASITRAAIYIAIADTFVALLAGVAIFPIVFANGLQPSAGPGLIFQTLPIAFGQMPYGSLFASLFFLMLVFAAITSTISLLEPSVAWLIETFRISRLRASLYAGFGIWILGLGTIFSFNILENVKIFGMTIFDNLDYLTANIMMPLGGLLTVFFAAWLMRRSDVLEELGISDRLLFRAWYFAIRYLTPLAILLIFLNFVGIIQF